MKDLAKLSRSTRSGCRTLSSSLLVVLAALSIACGPRSPSVAAPDSEGASTDASPSDEENPAAAGNATMNHGAMDHTGTHEAAVGEGAAVRFAEEIFGSNAGDYGITFTPDGRTIFFTRAIPTANSEAVYTTRLVGERWTEPELAPFSGDNHDKEPYVSPDGRRVYFASRRSPSGTGQKQDFDIWYAERRGDGWGDPVRLDAVNSDYDDDYPAVSADGTFVFARTDDADNVDLWIAYPSGEGLGEPQAFERPINSVYPDADPWIAPDAGLIVFSSPRIAAESQGQGDLYLIHRSGDGWTPPVSLDPIVNSIAHEYGPALSPDGATFYFSRGFGGHVWFVPLSALSNF